MIETKQFLNEFIEQHAAGALFSSEDTIEFVKPLFEEVLSFHETGLVAPFDRELSVFLTNGVLDIDEDLAHAPENRLHKIESLNITVGSGLEITSTDVYSTELETGQSELDTEEIGVDGQEILHPVYLTHFKSYEIKLGHHDELTDIFCLGMIL